MAAVFTEEDEETLRKQCEKTSLEDGREATARKTKAQLPPIKLGMSFSDWKQMKEAEQNNTNVTTGKIWKPPAKLRQNQNFIRPTFESHPSGNQLNNNQKFRNQQQHFPNFNAFPSQHNQQQQQQQGRRNFFQDQVIPTPKIRPLRPPPPFEDFCNEYQQHWSGGPLMQPMFPPMPRIPRIQQQQQQGMRINTSGQQHNRFQGGPRRPSARSNPKSGQTGFRTMAKAIKKASPIQKPNTSGNVNEESTTTPTLARTEPQVYVYRPRNTNTRSEKFKTNWVVMPKAPPPINTNTPESREEQARLWREYRQAMKPFKNREFANAKRVIQRLGKKDASELDEKQRERLERANELVNSHKAMLTERMAKRSARVEQQIKFGKPNYGIGATTENQLNSNNSWVGNNNNKSIAEQTLNQSQGQRSIANSFVAGGVMQPPPPNALQLTKSQS